VTIYLTALAVIALLVAGWALVYVGLQRSLQRAAERRHFETEHRLEALSAALKALQARLEEQGEVALMQAAAAPEFTMEAAQGFASAPEPEAVEEPVRQPDGELSPETMAVLAAAVTAFLGKKVRILSARLLESPNEGVNAWSQQGRVFVQASHNLRARG
jgi:hypothetical protein